MDEKEPAEGPIGRLSRQAMRAVEDVFEVPAKRIRPVMRASVQMVMHYSDAMKRSMTIRVVRYGLIAAALAVAWLLGLLVGFW